MFYAPLGCISRAYYAQVPVAHAVYELFIIYPSYFPDFTAVCMS